jgi:arsenate reductase (thioredoxin)
MIKVLFVCIHNSARSQMAEAFLNRLGEGKFVAESAGLEKGTLNPYVVRVMDEIGYDISQNSCDSVFEFYRQGRIYEVVVKVCDQINGERCPIFPNTRLNLNWNIEDPSSFTSEDEKRLQETRLVRDKILAKVQDFIANYTSV